MSERLDPTNPPPVSELDDTPIAVAGERALQATMAHGVRHLGMGLSTIMLVWAMSCLNPYYPIMLVSALLLVSSYLYTPFVHTKSPSPKELLELSNRSPHHPVHVEAAVLLDIAVKAAIAERNEAIYKEHVVAFDLLGLYEDLQEALESSPLPMGHRAAPKLQRIREVRAAARAAAPPEAPS